MSRLNRQKLNALTWAEIRYENNSLSITSLSQYTSLRMIDSKRHKNVPSQTATTTSELSRETAILRVNGPSPVALNQRGEVSSGWKSREVGLRSSRTATTVGFPATFFQDEQPELCCFL